MIEIYLKYDNMHIFGMINAFNCINNHVISCINSMLSIPLCSRLNHYLVEAGFIMINRWIRSNSPLERRTSAEEETKPILFNPRELKPNICGN